MTAPMTRLPAMPSRADPANFSQRGDAGMAALPVMVDEFNARLPVIDAAVQAGIDAVAAAAAAAASAASAVAAPGTNATSTTALTVGAGVLNLTIQPNKDFVPGAMFICARTADPDNVWMLGQARSYTKATGALVLVVAAGETKGSGTFSDWTLSLSSMRSSVLGPVDSSQVGPSIKPSLLWDAANSKRLPVGAVYVMNSPLSYIDAAGVRRIAPAGVPAFDHDPATLRCLGLSMWDPRTNSIRNNTNQGASVGTPGVMPTYWQLNLVAGLTPSIVGIGAENGWNYIDIRFFGTPTATANSTIVFESTIAAAVSQAWAHTGSLKLAAGSAPPVGISVHEFDAGLSFLRGTNAVPAVGPTLSRYTQVITTGASTAYVRPMVYFASTNGVAQDFTLRIAMPSIEQGASAGPVIDTSGSAVTRSAPSLYVLTSAFDYNALEGTLMVGYVKCGTLPASGVAALNNAGGTDYVLIRDGSLLGGSPGSSDLVVYVGSVSQVDTAGYITADGGQHNSVAAYKLNDFAFTGDGNSVMTDTLGTVPNVDRISVGGTHGGSFGGWISKLAYYPKRLANSELVALSTL